ncbi:MAG TPA: putative colanic acid biosynthesis acetyltransferase [Methylophilaceae bacterium]|jgi:putative colanic acid biosynthesis acetyltransferase WcaF
MIIENNDPTTQPSFSLKNRAARVLWGVVWVFCFRYSPRPCHAWRKWLLQLFGAKLGEHVHVYPNVRVWAPWQLTVGHHSGLADGVVIYNIAPITIGHHCVVSQGAYLCTGSHDIDSANFQLIAKPIVLQDYVWVCAQAFVGPGVGLAEGCVLGAHAVVVKTIDQAWTVWAGNPVTFKRMRKQAVKK